MKPVLYGNTLSPFVRKVKVVLMEKGIDHDLVPILPFEKTPEFLEASPAGKIPYYKDEQGRIVNDSSVIVAYIGECHPEPAMMPQDPYLKSRARWLEEYMDTTLAPNLLFPIFGQRIILPLFMKQPTDQKLVDEAIGKVPGYLGYLEKQLGNNEYFVGNTFSVADISVASAFVNLEHADFSIDAATFPNLAKWYKRVTERSSFAQIIAAEKAALADAKKAG